MSHLSAEQEAYVLLSHFEGIGPQRFQLLKNYFGSAENIVSASESLLKKTGLPSALVERFISFKKRFSFSDLGHVLTKKRIHVITDRDDLFPERLAAISGAPFILYAIGRLELLKNERTIAVVGTRKPTPYGIEVTKKITRDLVVADITIVSGMAMGIDAVAHTITLDQRGNTIAVLGCGVDICYPAINRALYERLQSHGLIISEFPPGMRTSKGVFPARNRIVAALSRGVLITEGAARSGSLITARYASDYGKDVFAVPGPITSPMSDATTLLIKEGATPVSSGEDIITHYKDAPRFSNTLVAMEAYSEDERHVISLIQQNGSLHIDALSRDVGIAVHELSGIISSLELQAVIVEVGEGEYALAI